MTPAHWRSGIGGALIEAALEAAKQRGFSEVSLWVLTGNSSARAFYEARQFRTDGETKLDERRGFSIHETRYRRSIA
ncbi:MAG: GNAT family N-acetyltransferase [Pseudomonadota bacterium]